MPRRIAQLFAYFQFFVRGVAQLGIFFVAQFGACLALMTATPAHFESPFCQVRHLHFWQRLGWSRHIRRRPFGRERGRRPPGACLPTTNTPLLKAGRERNLPEQTRND